MREFIVLGRRDRRRIVVYVIVLVLVMSLSNKLLGLTKDMSQIIKQEQSKLKPFGDLEPVLDFYDFPCFPGLAASPQLKRNGKCVRGINKVSIPPGIWLDERCQVLPVSNKPTVCTYKPLRKNESIFIHGEGQKHKENIDILLNVLGANPNMHFFDIGDNDGAYCIASAMKTIRTVCMNGNYRKVKLLWKSLVMNRKPDHARLIWNVLADEPKSLAGHLYSIDEIREVNSVGRKAASPFGLPDVSNQQHFKVNGVTLNDLTGLFSDYANSSIFMKLDMDDIDVNIVPSGDRFFRFNAVKIIQIYTTSKHKGNDMTDLLQKYGFQPRLHPLGDTIEVSKLKQSDVFPKNVYFVK